LTSDPLDFSSLYASNRFFFLDNCGADPNLDYRQWSNRKTTQYLDSFINLSGYAAAHKQVVLIFGFDVLHEGINGRVLIYTNAGLLKDQELAYGDNQFLLEIESLDAGFHIYFIHVSGHWFFRGLSG
jgi:hypothetical protein